MNWFNRTARLRAPICLTWQITNKCNLACIHCLSNSRNKETDELNMDEIIDFLDDLASMKVFYINMGGGEPLLHPNFFDIVDYAQYKGIYIQFSTNGTMIERTMAKMIAQRGLRVQVSMDGVNQEKNDFIRGKGSFNKAINAIRLLQENHVQVSVNCVVTKSNLEDLNDIYKLVVSLGAKLRLSRLRPSGRATESWMELSPNRQQYVYLYQWLKKHPDVNTGDSFFFLSALGEALPGLNFCGAWDLTCSVDPQGNIHPCPFLIKDKMLIGNIRNKPLSKWWNENLTINNIIKKKPSICEACQNFLQCRGGCRGASFCIFGNWDEPDPDCMKMFNL